MSTVTIRIAADAAVATDFQVVLIEENGRETSAPLPAAAWNCDFGKGPATPADIVDHVSGVDAAARQGPEFGRIGAVLYDWLFPVGPVRQRWDALSGVQQPPVTLDIRDPERAKLPWEMARSPKPAQIRISTASVFQRFEPPLPLPNRCSPWPLRLLFVIGCSQADERALGVDQEWEQIERTFVPLGRSVDVQCLRRPTRADLQNLIRSHHPHVFHFAGHGGTDPVTGDPGLRFDLDPNSWIWSSADIPTNLRSWGWSPAFVFLNACRSGTSPRASWSVQQTFLGAGAKWVLGMQADIAGDVAGPFAAKIYRECATGKTVGQAVFEGRMDLNATDGWIPVLISTTAAGKLFEPSALPTGLPFAQCREFEHAKFYANCKDGRRAFMHWLKPPVTPAPETPHKNVAVLLGQPRSGKSHLLKWCMESWTLADARVRYIELHSGAAKTFLSVLRQIRDGDSDGSHALELLHGGLPATAFRRFNWELKNFIDTGKSGEWNAVVHGLVNVGDDLRPLSAFGENRIESNICAAFLNALKLAAADAPLILVFDRFTGAGGERLIPKSEFHHLVQHLFLPIAREPASPVKLVFVVDQGQQLEFDLNLLPASGVMPWTLPVNYSNEQLTQLAAEMFWFQEETKIKQLTKSLLDFPSDPGAPVGLAFLQNVFSAIEQKSKSLVANVERMR